MSGTIDVAMYEELVQIATNTSGGGTNVTIVGPKGSQNTAGSVAVALATDQVAIPTNATIVAPKGQTTMANSIPVSMASDQTNINIVQHPQGVDGGIPSHAISAASTNATLVKNNPGNVYGISISNTNAAARYFRIFNKATAPVPGTDVPITTIQIPANSTVMRAYIQGLFCSTGIGYDATGGMGDTDATAIGAGDLSMDLDYR